MLAAAVSLTRVTSRRAAFQETQQEVQRKVAGIQTGDKQTLELQNRGCSSVSTVSNDHWCLFHVTEWPKNEADNSLPFCTGIQAAWIFTSMASHVFKSYDIVMLGYFV
jgi:hypothetical protein